MARRMRAILGVAVAFLFVGIQQSLAQNELSVDRRTADAGAIGVRLGIHLTSDSAVSAFSFGVTFPPGSLSITDLALDEFVADAFAGAAPLVLIDLAAAPGAATLVVDFDEPLSNLDPAIPPAASLRIASAQFDLVPGVATCLPAAVTIAPVGMMGMPGFVPVELVDPTGVALPAPMITAGGITALAAAPLIAFDTGAYFVGTAPPTIALVRGSPAAGAEVVFAAPLPPGSEPEGIAVSPQGGVWATGGDIDQIGKFDAMGALVDFADVGPNPISIAIDGDGDIWVGHAGDSSLWKLSSDGCVLIGPGGALRPDAIVLAAPPSAHAEDGAHNLWAMSDDGHLYKIAPDGSELLHLGLDGVLRDIAIDPQHRIWITHDGDVELRASDGSLIAEFSLGPMFVPHHIAVRGDKEAWVTETATGGVYRIMSDGVADLFFALPAPSGIAVDGSDRVIVAEADGNVAYVIDPTAIPPLLTPPSIDLGFSPDFHGDAAGYQQANLISPLADFDLDGVSNRPEIAAGSNPFSIDSVPEAPPVNNLACQVAAAGGVVTLTWENQVAYSLLQVLADGAVIADLPGDATSYDAPGLVSGTHVLAVAGIGASGVFGPAASCSATIGTGAILFGFPLALDADGEIVLPVDIAFLPPATSIALGPGASAIRSVVVGQNGRIYALNANLQVIAQFASPYASPGGVAFAPWGNGGAGSVFVANSSSLPEITQVTLTGAVINDSTAPLSDVDLIGAPITSLTASGTSEANGAIFASAPITCEIWPFAASNYSLVTSLQFEHPGATASIGYPGQNGCQVIPSAGIDGLGELPESVTIALTVEDTAGAYDIRFYEVQDSIATEVGESIPLFAAGALDNTFAGFSFSADPELGNLPGEDTVVLIGASTHFLYAIRAGETGAPFLRGDGNGDGIVFGLTDALVLLTWTFLDGADPPCLDAADVNDDGAASALVDALYLLNYAFTGGPDPPLPGANACGPDLTPDAIGCGFYAGCE